MKTKAHLALVGVLLGPAACGPSVGDPPPGASSSESSGAEPSGSTDPGTTGASSTAGLSTSTAADGGSSTADAVTTSSTTGESTGAPICVPMCDDPADCNDGIDNDGDGLVDTEDVDCVSPCHNGEESAYHEVRSGQGGCDEDCYFDDNSGHGDDGCFYDMSCDPLGPKAWKGCDADPKSPQCQNALPQAPECLAACLPLVPPGCDCFGCCTLPTPSGLEDRWLGDPSCTLTDPTTCPPCTPSPDCVNLCDDPCEWCLGMPSLPEGCPEATCDAGPPCTDHCDCPDGFACLQGCCRPLAVL
jgi:hypothetical protein